MFSLQTRVFAITLAVLSVGVVMFGQILNRSVQEKIPPPSGYARVRYDSGSFAAWIQTLPLRQDLTIHTFDRRAIVSGAFDVFAVVDMSLLFRSDIEQCADFCMRFWAEYYKAANKLNELYLFDYYGRKQSFARSGKSFREFLRWAFAYSNSYSLKRGCKAVTGPELQPGDLIVQNERGGIGHVSMIMDVCKSRSGEKLYLVGFSFMPAQEFHIEKARAPYGNSGWFTLDGYYHYLRDFLNVGTPVLRRFPG